MKIAVSGERLGRALPSKLNSVINYFRPVSVKKQHKTMTRTVTTKLKILENSKEKTKISE